MLDIDQIISFVRGQYKTNNFIPLHQPRFRGNEKKYVLETIDSTFVSSVGAFVDQFEKQIGSIANTKNAIAVVNGTAALQVALQLSGVRSGDEVITQALTFVATVNAISYLNAKPIFVDVDLDTMGLSPKSLEVFLDEFGEIKNEACYNKKTSRKIAACLPMHTFGFPVHMKELIKVCEKWKIPIVEDAAESLGSTYYGQPTGSFGKLGIFSFNGNKIVTAGGGGAIVTNITHLGDEAKHLTTTAKRPHNFEYFHDQLGYNYRMPNLNAALLCAQLEQLDTFIQEKRNLAADYTNFFSTKGIKFRTETPNTKANYWLMCIELNDKQERDIFLKETNENGVMTRPIWQLMYRLPMYQNCQRDQQKNAEFLEERIVNIPSSVR